MEDLLSLLPVLAIAAAIIIGLVGAAVKVVQEYERGVIFRLGRLIGAKGPGLFFIIPFIDRMVKVDLRTVTLDVPTQEAITRDNVTVRFNAVVYFRVVDPEAAIVRVENFMLATMQIAQTTMRSVLGQSELDELLSKREEINSRLQTIIDQQTEPWGIKVSVVEVKDVELPQTMQRAMARQAEAERDKRAKVIHAEGEFLAAQQLSEAAHIINTAPSALQLRYLQTLGDISSEQSRVIIFPLPMDLISAFIGSGRDSGGGGGDAGRGKAIQPVTPPAATPPTPKPPSAEDIPDEGPDPEELPPSRRK